MHITILGRQPFIGMAELERRYGPGHVSWFSDLSALIETEALDIEQLGGSLKAGRVVLDLPRSDWRRASQTIMKYYTKKWHSHTGKMTLGISTYGFDISPRDVQKVGITIKQNLKKSGVSLRLIPNTEAQLNTATSHHNKLGLAPNKVELLIIRGKDRGVVIAESTGSQNITSLAARDQARPKRDAFIGMLPPKLAQIMLNLAMGQANFAYTPGVLDPFCGTGVILQEAMLRGWMVFGTDLNPKMVQYALENLAWLQKHMKEKKGTILTFDQADAATYRWLEASNVIDAVVTETYLGQPFSAPPSTAKLVEVRDNCNNIITKFLKNIGSQIPSGLPLCLAVPAWRNADGSFTHLPFIKRLDKLGFKQVSFKNVSPSDLLYYREDQVVARELLVLEKI